MSISLNGGFDLNAYNDTISSAQNSKNAAERLTNSMSSLSANSSEEELTEAVKSFESYFVEQTLKQFKETTSFFSGSDDEDSTLSMYSDLYIDSTISDIASQLVDQYGGQLTEQFVEQMKINYGIGNAGSTVAAEAAGEQEAADNNI